MVPTSSVRTGTSQCHVPLKDIICLIAPRRRFPCVCPMVEMIGSFSLLCRSAQGSSSTGVWGWHTAASRRRRVRTYDIFKIAAAGGLRIPGFGAKQVISALATPSAGPEDANNDPHRHGFARRRLSCGLVVFAKHAPMCYGGFYCVYAL